MKKFILITVFVLFSSVSFAEISTDWKWGKVFNSVVLVSGENIAEAFMLMYYLDRACKTQIDAESTGEKLIIPSNNIMEYAAGQYEDPRFQLGKYEWPALLRLLEKNHSIYKQ